MKEWRDTDRFRCCDDNGREYEVVESTEFLEYHSRKNGSVHRATALKRYFLDDGATVQYIDDNTFKIAATGIVIRKIF